MTKNVILSLTKMLPFVMKMLDKKGREGNCPNLRNFTG